jgi:hypothetical protein
MIYKRTPDRAIETIERVAAEAIDPLIASELREAADWLRQQNQWAKEANCGAWSRMSTTGYESGCSRAPEDCCRPFMNRLKRTGGEGGR